MKEFLTSLVLKKSVTGLIATGALLFSFGIGVSVGHEQARFSLGYGDRFHEAFGNNRTHGMPLPFESFSDGHGATGKILSISLPSFVIDGPDGVEKVVVTDSSTVIRRFRDTISPSELTTSDFAIVIGTPNDKSQIVAKLIRLLPPPNTASSTKSK